MQYNISGVVMAMPWDLAAASHFTVFRQGKTYIIKTSLTWEHTFKKVCYLLKQLWLLIPNKVIKILSYKFKVINFYKNCIAIVLIVHYLCSQISPPPESYSWK